MGATAGVCTVLFWVVASCCSCCLDVGTAGVVGAGVMCCGFACFFWSMIGLDWGVVDTGWGVVFGAMREAMMLGGVIGGAAGSIGWASPMNRIALQ